MININLNGGWIGSTYDGEGWMHEWQVTHRDTSLFIYAQIEGESHVRYYSAVLRQNEPAFDVNGVVKLPALLVDDGHFVIQGWEAGHDMMFSRFGLDELAVEDAWDRYFEMNNRNRW